MIVAHHVWPVRRHVNIRHGVRLCSPHRSFHSNSRTLMCAKTTFTAQTLTKYAIIMCNISLTAGYCTAQQSFLHYLLVSLFAPGSFRHPTLSPTRPVRCYSVNESVLRSNIVGNASLTADFHSSARGCFAI